MYVNHAIAGSRRGFEIPGAAQIVEGNGGLLKVCVSTAHAEGEIYLHGAHVTSWKPAGCGETLFVSSESRWEDSRAIRGGIPICFPWFGVKADDANAPTHGFVRTKAWQIESITQVGDAVRVTMFTESNEDTKRWWPAEFRAVYRATFASELTLELEVTNHGQAPVRFEEALHAYHRVGDIERAQVQGLDGVCYLDKTDANQEKKQQGEIAIVSETDRVYLDTSGPIEVSDFALGRRTRITKENSRTTVVWNPWIEKARSLPDFLDDEWKRMVCIETSNVSRYSVALAPRQRHTIKAVMRVDNL